MNLNGMKRVHEGVKNMKILDCTTTALFCMPINVLDSNGSFSHQCEMFSVSKYCFHVYHYKKYCFHTYQYKNASTQDFFNT
jgi:hypothetical protein